MTKETAIYVIPIMARVRSYVEPVQAKYEIQYSRPPIVLCEFSQ